MVSRKWNLVQNLSIFFDTSCQVNLTLQNILHNIFNIVLQNDTRLKDNYSKVKCSNPLKIGHSETECIEKRIIFVCFFNALPFQNQTKMSSLGDVVSFSMKNVLEDITVIVVFGESC